MRKVLQMNELTNDELKLIIDVFGRIDLGKDIKTSGADDFLKKTCVHLYSRCENNGGHDWAYLSEKVIGGFNITGCAKCGFIPNLFDEPMVITIGRNVNE